MLTEAQQRLRDNRLTASRVGCLMSGDEAKILNLWREMVGSPDFEPEDLTNIWPVQLGIATEALHLDWYERRTGRPITRRGEVAIHPQREWAAATLDGWDDTLGAPVECKHVGGFEKREVVIARYQPQCHWQMLVTGATRVELSIIEGAKEPVRETILWDSSYGAELWGRAEAFMRCVVELTPPVAMPAVSAPIPAVREVDMSASNSWSKHAYAWLSYRNDARLFDSATSELKELMPKDAALAFGAGVFVTRAKNGALTVRGVKA